MRRRSTTTIMRRRSTSDGSTERLASRRSLPADVEHSLQQSAVYQVSTLGGDWWFEPFTGQAIAVRDSLADTARTWLLANPLWRSQAPMTLQRLQFLRWSHELRTLLGNDRRFVVFGPNGQGWVNPFNGTWHADVAAPERRVTKQTVQQIAALLASTHEVATGHILDLSLLRNIAARQAPVTQPPPLVQQLSAEAQTALQRATEVQQRLLSQLPAIPGWELALHYAGHQGVSGDFYVAIPIDDRFLILLGDVSGHGLQGALVVATIVKAARHLARSFSTLGDFLSRLNDDIKPDLLAGQFVTVCAALLDPRSAEVELALAGHHPAWVLNAHAATPLRRVGSSGMALGLCAGHIFSRSLRMEVLELEPGDQLLLFTDGLLEAQNAEEEEYGLPRFLASLLAHPGPVQQRLDAAAQAAMDFANGHLHDDATLLSVGLPLPPEQESEELETVEHEEDLA